MKQTKIFTFFFLISLFSLLPKKAGSQTWSSPVALTTGTLSDRNPAVSVFIAVTLARPVCLCWETDRNGNWDIYSRFNYTGTEWSSPIAVTTDPDSDINCSVAYDTCRSLWWCAWQSKRDGNWNIYVSSGDSLSGWSIPTRISSSSATEQNPTIAVSTEDSTVWVVWESDSTGYWNIYSRYYNGTTWSSIMPITADTFKNAHPKIATYTVPSRVFAVWESNRDGNWNIYQSVYSGSWSPPAPFTTADLFNDLSPSLVSDFTNEGGWTLWQCDSSGNYEIYSAGGDTNRITQHDSADITPAGISLGFPVRQFGPPYCIVWATNRDGNYNIYSLQQMGIGLLSVDQDPSDDRNPVVSAITVNSNYYLWAIWESNRDGNWNIYGSYQIIPVGGVEETAIVNHQPLTINYHLYQNHPNPFTLETTIFYTCPTEEKVSIKIYDLLGRLVRTLVNESQRAGEHNIKWDGKDSEGRTLPSGVYFCSFETPNYSSINKMLFLK